ncbi:MAG: GNAT family N-acetyltransferase [Melioribacteraceae bacterium]|nr:GNAT family N-acetyltransferase [Melioribacteraceae bacterium]
MKYRNREIKSKKNNEFIIREAKIEDADNIKYCKEVSSSDLINIQNRNGDSYKVTQEEESVIKDCIVGENGIVLIAEKKNKMIGFISVLVTSEKESQHIGILGIAIIKEFRSEGIGSILTEEVLQWAKNSKTLKKIILTVDIDNIPAVKLYEKYGFITESIIDSKELMKKNATDQYLMSFDV